jgi:hypothetical protein
MADFQVRLSRPWPCARDLERRRGFFSQRTSGFFTSVHAIRQLSATNSLFLKNIIALARDLLDEQYGIPGSTDFRFNN